MFPYKFSSKMMNNAPDNRLETLDLVLTHSWVGQPSCYMKLIINIAPCQWGSHPDSHPHNMTDDRL